MAGPKNNPAQIRIMGVPMDFGQLAVELTLSALGKSIL